MVSLSTPSLPHTHTLTTSQCILSVEKYNRVEYISGAHVLAYKRCCGFLQTGVNLRGWDIIFNETHLERG